MIQGKNAYAEDVNYEFDHTEVTPDLPNKSRRARLLAKKLRPETYTVAAKVRILGKRKDIICEPYIYMGDLSTQQLSYLPPFVQH